MMTPASRSDFAANGRNALGARRELPPAPAVFSSRSLTAKLDCGEYLIRPTPQGPDDENARSFVMVPWNYRPTARMGPEPLIVSELEDPEQGCRAPGYEGLTCSCPGFNAVRPCPHVRELVAIGLLRPAPGWPDEVLDLVLLVHPGDE